MRTGGKILVDQLVANGCRTLFTIPGESFLPALDALFDDGPIRTIVCRQEGGAAMMAEAMGKLTGGPGVAFVTRAAGAANAVSGVYVAHHDATPMLLLVGLSSRAKEDRGTFQEIDLKPIFGAMTKWVGIVRSAERIPEYVARAYQTAMAGRPGPVVLGFPEDVLHEPAKVADAAFNGPASPAPSGADMAFVKGQLATSKRPLVLIGGGNWSQHASDRLASVAKRFDLPVATAFRRQDHFDNRHQNYVGHAGLGMGAKLATAVRRADLLLVVGEAPGDVTTEGYSLVEVPRPKQVLVHAHPSADEPGRLYRTDLPIAAAPLPFIKALARFAKPNAIPTWAHARQDLRRAYERSLKPVATPGSVKLEAIIAALSAELPEDAIVTNGAGNYTAFLHRYYQWKSYPSQLAPTSGSMGYGLPAAIAAKLAYPERTVVALAGDGCMLMTVQELATAVQYGLPIVIIVANNAMYGTIRMRQERLYPGRVVATSLVNPDFAALARSFGAAGVTITRTEDFLPVLRRALTVPLPTVIELRLDPEAISPRQTLSEIRQTERAKPRKRR